MISFCSRQAVLLLIAILLCVAAVGFAAGPVAEDCGSPVADGCRSQEMVDSCEAESSGTSCEDAEALSPAFSGGQEQGEEEKDASSELKPVESDRGAVRWPIMLLREADARELNDARSTELAQSVDAAAVVLECAAMVLIGAALIGISVQARRGRFKQ